jgi:hypothetical protein
LLIAQQKRKENIAEYLLYMWQIEDIIRGCNRDIEVIEKNVIGNYGADEATRHEIREWYESLIMMMKAEHREESGHLQINKNVLIRLNDLHLQLIKSVKYPEYGAEYYRTLPFIVELRAKTQEAERVDELETCFDALYGILLLKLQGKEITNGTDAAIKQISHFIALLAYYFKKNEEKPLFEDKDFN